MRDSRYCYSARLSHRNSVRPSVRPSVSRSVRLLHGWISQKRCKLFDAPVKVEVLEAEDIEDADGLADVSRVSVDSVDGGVDLVDEPDEHSSVDAFDQRVAHVHGGFGVERLGDTLAARLNCLRCQRVVQTRVVHLNALNSKNSSRNSSSYRLYGCGKTCSGEFFFSPDHLSFPSSSHSFFLHPFTLHCTTLQIFNVAQTRKNC